MKTASGMFDCSRPLTSLMILSVNVLKNKLVAYRFSKMVLYILCKLKTACFEIIIAGIAIKIHCECYHGV